MFYSITEADGFDLGCFQAKQAKLGKVFIGPALMVAAATTSTFAVSSSIDPKRMKIGRVKYRYPSRSTFSSANQWSGAAH